MAGGPEAQLLEQFGVVEWDALATEAHDEAVKLRGEILQIAACQQAPEMTVVGVVAVFSISEAQGSATDAGAFGMVGMDGVKRRNGGGPVIADSMEPPEYG